MASQFSISQINFFASISLYLAGNDRSSLMQLQSGSFVGNLPQLLYMEGTLLQNLNSLNPASSTLRGTAEYVLSLCGKYLTQAQTILNNLAGAAPAITGPANQSVLVGGTATFSVTVTGSSPLSYQWLLNGSPIVGAISSSYVVSNAQLAQNGALYSVQVSNLAGSVTSNTATLTVTANIVGYYYYGTDFSAQLEAGNDDLPYQGTFPITSGQPLVVTFPSGAANMWIAVKYPNTETTKTTYNNPPLNTGVIPNIALRTTAFGSWKYIFSAPGTVFGLNTSQPITFS